MGIGEGQSEAAGSDIEDDFEVSVPTGFQIGIQHNDPEDWLDELRATVAECGDRVVRISLHKEPREDVSDIFVIGGFFDSEGTLCELIARSEQVDYHGMLFEGTEEARRLKDSLKLRCKAIAETLDVEIVLLGGRFTVK